ncbi:MAG: response regulator [Gammaproteobacteria bacterium]|nr:MAG: response regulator [Gammaproteobacteria bacterium]QMU62659.1 MAG: response regulator [Gammaproteobacteria bacterium]
MIHKVLVVDDSVLELENLKKIISNEGYQVISAVSGKEAVEKAKSMQPDLIFMDVIMDDQDGFQACREITADRLTKDIPVIFVTGKSQKVDRVWAGLQGGKALIAKPYTPDQIISQINRYS